MASNFWDERYGRDDYVYGREPNEFLRRNAGVMPPGRVLCLADGEGRNGVFLAGLGYDVLSLDFSVEGLRKAEALARERHVRLQTLHADLATYEPEHAVYSGIVAIFAHLPQVVRRRVHGWVPDALAPGGVFLLEAYTPRQLAFDTGGPRDPTMLMTLAELEHELLPLHVEFGEESEREIREGVFHTGPGATVQLIARRRA